MKKYPVGDHLTKYKQFITQEINRQEKSIHKNWKDRWLPFIKYDQDWDGEYLLQLIVYKLHLYYDFYSNPDNVYQSEDGRQAILKTLKETLDVGDKLLSHSFESAAAEFFDEHTQLEQKQADDNLHLTCIWDDPENKIEYERLLEKSTKEENEALTTFFKLLRDHIFEWWD